MYSLLSSSPAVTLSQSPRLPQDGCHRLTPSSFLSCFLCTERLLQNADALPSLPHGEPSPCFSLLCGKRLNIPNTALLFAPATLAWPFLFLFCFLLKPFNNFQGNLQILDTNSPPTHPTKYWSPGSVFLALYHGSRGIYICSWSFLSPSCETPGIRKVIRAIKVSSVMLMQ